MQYFVKDLCPKGMVMNMTDKSLPPGSITPVGKRSEKVEMGFQVSRRL